MGGLTTNGRPTSKNTDSKGRVTLGARYANRTVIVQEVSDTELVVKLARVVPEGELRALEVTAGNRGS